MSWGVLPWVYPVWDSLGFLDLGDYFLPHFREVFNYYLLKYFLMVFLFVFFFWDSYDSNVVAFDVVPLPRFKLLRFKFSGTAQRHRLGWACILCPSRVQAAQTTRCLASALSPGEAV